ncbi:MAG: sigma-70 family RNA polymerase sigma factor [Anaerolineae bacterium]|nr:sigma-70 family RNA polymerase sigma factor [Anaerolineae bacterium]
MDNQPSDSVLIARAKEDLQAFGGLYERYAARIYRYIYYRTGNHADAEDLTAKTFHRALRHIHHYTDRGAPFAAWLYRIAHNIVANWVRDQNRHPMVALDAIAMPKEERLGPHATAESKEDTERLLLAVRKLHPERQELLILKFVEEMTNAEIGAVMGRTEGAVKSLYHRTLVALREDLDTHLENNRQSGGRDG